MITTQETYRKTATALQVFVFGFPIFSKIIDVKSKMPFPPVGDDSNIWKFMGLIFIGVAALFPYFFPVDRHKAKLIGGFFFFFALLALAYLGLKTVYARPIPRPDGSVIFVTRGSSRQPDLKEPWRSMNDDKLIAEAGQSDADLALVYTDGSLLANRLKLFSSYVGSLMCLELCLGCIAKSGD